MGWAGRCGWAVDLFGPLYMPIGRASSFQAECRFLSDSPAKRSRCVLAAASQNEPQTRANESKMLRVACITTVAGKRGIRRINHDGTARRERIHTIELRD